jgi:MSHA pilin protein MshA
MKQQKGFTLIELVVVIVILGILGAIALPKFVDMGGDARASVMKGLGGAMSSANSMVYAKAQAAGTPGTTATPATVTIAGQSVSVANGFAKDAIELAKVMDLQPAADFTVAAGSIKHAKAATPANCIITYTAATATTPPVYDVSGVTSANCS